MVNEPPTTPPVPAAVYTDAQLLGISLQQPQRTMKVIPVFESEFDAITSIGASIYPTFFGISVGSFVSFVVVISTVDNLSPLQAAGFTGLTWASGLASLLLGIQSAINVWRARKKIAILKGNKS